MIYSLKGTIVEVMPESVAIEVGDVGYEVLVSRPSDFTLGMQLTLYTAEVLAQDDHYLVGFSSRLEKEAFLSLTSVKGIGPKTAINALSATNPDDLFKAISANNTAYLKKLPGIGPKAAAQIILDLKGKLVETDGKGNPHQYEEVRAALKQLGYKVKEIDEALSTISEPGADHQTILRLALKALSKN